MVIFQARLAANPTLGAVIRGSGGLRKVRVTLDARGKRSGARVVYYWAVRREIILLPFAYAKNETSDLTKKQIGQLAKLVKQEFSE